jgi:hypothetical protein
MTGTEVAGFGGSRLATAEHHGTQLVNRAAHRLPTTFLRIA